jgi:hypothetical protein
MTEEEEEEEEEEGAAAGCCSMLRTLAPFVATCAALPAPAFVVTKTGCRN